MKRRIILVNMLLQWGFVGSSLSVLLVTWMLPGARPAEASPFAYVTNAFSHSVSVIDTANNSLTATVTLPEGRVPFAVAITPDSKHAYVTTLNAFATEGGSVFLVDTESNTVVGEPIVVGSEPTGIAITPAGEHAYVANRFTGSVSVIDTVNNIVSTTIMVEGSPRAVAITPDGKRVYVTNEIFGTVLVIDTASNTVLGTPITVGSFPQGIAITPDGKHAYVTNSSFPGSSVSVIDTTSNTVVATIEVENNPSAVAITPDGKHAHVTNGGAHSVSVIDTASNAVIGSSIPVGFFPGAIAITPDGKHAYVTNEGSHNVSVIDTVTNTVSSTIEGMNSPRGVAITPAVAISVPFDTFDPKVFLLRRNSGHDVFLAKGSFTLGEASDGIDPLTESVAFSLADIDGTFFDQTLPQGSFEPFGKGGFLFRAPGGSNGIRLMIVRPTKSAGQFTFKVLGKKLDLSEADNPPVTVSLQIGDDSGAETISCQNLSKVLICR